LPSVGPGSATAAPTSGASTSPSSAPTTGTQSIPLSTASPVALNETISVGAQMLPGQSAPDIMPRPNNATVDGFIPCLPTMPGTFHEHTHLSIFVGTTQMIVPMAIGMYQPTPDQAGDYTSTATCFGGLHVHDHSGIVHQEFSSQPASVTLGNFLDVWGVTLNAVSFGPFNGTTYNGSIVVYTTQYGSGTNNPPTSVPVLFTGDPNTIPLAQHEEISVFVNPVYGAGGNTIPAYTFTF
jgi:hypothetical protein